MKPGKSLTLLLIILLVGAGLRFHMLAADVRFHPDEALFSTFARNAAVHGDWMLAGALDKTPASIYASAVSMHFVAVYENNLAVRDMSIRQGEFAARLPNVLLGIVLIALTGACVPRNRKVTSPLPTLRISLPSPNGEGKTSEASRGEVTEASLQSTSTPCIIAALLIALSPYALVFSGSAFTDMGMVTFGMLAVLAIQRKNGWLAGSALALSFAFKQQGILYLPLILMLALFDPTPALPEVREGAKSSIKQGDFLPRSAANRGRWRLKVARGGKSISSHVPTRIRCIAQLMLILALGIILLLIWDSARPETSIFTLAAENNRPGGLIAPPDSWLPRLGDWLGYAGWLLGPPLVTFPLLVLIAARMLRQGQRFDRIVAGYMLAYFALHWLINFNIYDRYLLPLAPLLAILAGRAVVLTSPLLASLVFPAPIGAGRENAAFMPLFVRGEISRWALLNFTIIWLILMIVFIALLTTAIQTSHWQIDLGRDHVPLDREGAIIAAADHINAKPLGTIVYDPWLGWEVGYYLGSWSNKRRVHYPTPAALVADAIANPETAPRYFIAPVTQDVATWLDALNTAGFATTVDYQNERVVIYQMMSGR